jgi:hypothetical protein
MSGKNANTNVMNKLNNANTTRNNAGLKNSNIVTNASSKSNGMQIFKIFMIVIIMIIIIGITFWIIVKMKKGNKSESKLLKESYVSLDEKVDPIDSSRMPVPAEGNEYTFNFWVYLSDNYASSAQHKIVMYRGEKEDESNIMRFRPSSTPIVVMDKTNNIMRVAVATSKVTSSMTLDEIFSPGNSNDKKYLTGMVTRFPLQKWVNITIMVIDNNLRIYVDSDIHSVYSTSEINGSPSIKISSGNIQVGHQSNGVKGHFSNLRYFNHSVSQEKLKAIYYAAPIPKTFLRYFGFDKYGVQSPIYKIE